MFLRTLAALSLSTSFLFAPDPAVRAPEAAAAPDPTAQAETAVAEGRLAEAIVIYEAKRAGQPRDLESREWLVKLFSWTEQAEKAIPILEEMVALRPKDDELAAKLAQYYIWFARAKEAIPLYEQIAVRKPKDKEIRLKIIEANLWFSQTDGALAAYAELDGIDPHNAEQTRKYAALLILTGQSESAIPLYERLVADDAENVEDLRQLIVLYGWNSRTDEMVPAYEALHRLAPADLEVTNKLAQQYEWNSRGAEAIPLLEALIKAEPKTLEYRTRLAQQLAGAGRGTEAVVHLKVVVAAKPDDLKARFLLAQITHWSPEWWTAKTNYLAILARDPEHADGLKYLSLLRSAHGPRLYAQFDVFRDTNDTVRFSEQLGFDVAVRGPIRIGVEVRHRDYFGRHYLLGNMHATENRTLGRIVVREEVFEGSVDLGAQQFAGIGANPYAAAKGQVNIKKKVTLGVSYEHARFTQGVPSIRSRVRYHQGSAFGFAFPTKWLSGSLSAGLSRMSDGNIRRQGYAAVVAAPFRERFLLSATVAGGHESYARNNPEALPYFTADVWALSPGLDIGYQKRDKIRVEAGYSLVIDNNGNKVHTPRAKLRWDITPADRLTLNYFNWGSPVYGYQMGIVQYEHRFRFRGQPRRRRR